MPPPPSPEIFTPNALEAYRLSIGIDFVVGALSVFIWDILYNLGIDYQIIRLHGINFPSAVYLLSRASTLGFTLMGAIVLTTPIKDCHSYSHGLLALYNILISTTMLLSYFRVCAVWNKNYYIISSFFFLWLTGVAGSLTVVKGLPFSHIEGSPYCDEFVLDGFVAAAVFAPTINHILAFIAITYGVCRNHVAVIHDKFTVRSGYKVFILGESLPAFSKALIQASQLCYLVAALSGIAAIIWFYVYASDPEYRIAIFVPYAVIVNIMFSWVFRSAKLTTNAIPAVPSTSINMHTATNARRNDIELARSGQGDGQTSASNLPIQIEVNRVIDFKEDITTPHEGKTAGTLDYLNFVL